jgi:hypothetical protein
LERHIEGPPPQSGGGFMAITNSYDHPNPYFPYNLDHVFDARGGSELMQLRMEDAIGDSEATKSLAKQLRSGEFYKWVDSFHDDEQK